MRLVVLLQNNYKNDVTNYSGLDCIKHFCNHHEPKELICDIWDGFDFHAAEREKENWDFDVKILNVPIVNYNFLIYAVGDRGGEICFANNRQLLTFLVT